MSEQQLDLFESNKDSEAPVAIVVLSGGQDSTTCLYWAKEQGYRVHAITIDYNQKHDRELRAAAMVAQLAGVESHELIRMGAILKGTSPLVSPDHELEQYEDHASLPGGLEKTFVPMRNQLFLTIAANRAYVLGARVIITGVAQEDYGGYPDCRRSFLNHLENAMTQGAFTGEYGAPHTVDIMTPLMDLTKKQTVQLAMRLPGCYEALAWSHTSYDGQYPPTGKDHATLLRAKGFEEAGIPDPLVLRAYIEGAMELPGTPNYDWETVGAYLDDLGEKFVATAKSITGKDYE